MIGDISIFVVAESKLTTVVPAPGKHSARERQSEAVRSTRGDLSQRNPGERVHTLGTGLGENTLPQTQLSMGVLAPGKQATVFGKSQTVPASTGDLYDNVSTQCPDQPRYPDHLFSGINPELAIFSRSPSEDLALVIDGHSVGLSTSGVDYRLGIQRRNLFWDVSGLVVAQLSPDVGATCVDASVLQNKGRVVSSTGHLPHSFAAEERGDPGVDHYVFMSLAQTKLPQIGMAPTQQLDFGSHGVFLSNTPECCCLLAGGLLGARGCLQTLRWFGEGTLPLVEHRWRGSRRRQGGARRL